MRQVDFRGQLVAKREPDSNVLTIEYYGGWVEQEDGSEKWVLEEDERWEWFCEYAEFEEDGVCHGCDGDKAIARCESLKPPYRPEKDPHQRRLTT